MPKLPLSVQDKMKNKLSTYVKTYEKPEVDENGKVIAKINSKEENKQNKANENKDDENGEILDDEEDINDIKASLPLGEGVL